MTIVFRPATPEPLPTLEERIRRAPVNVDELVQQREKRLTRQGRAKLQRAINHVLTPDARETLIARIEAALKRYARGRLLERVDGRVEEQTRRRRLAALADPLITELRRRHDPMAETRLLAELEWRRREWAELARRRQGHQADEWRRQLMAAVLAALRDAGVPMTIPRRHHHVDSDVTAVLKLVLWWADWFDGQRPLMRRDIYLLVRQAFIDIKVSPM